MAADQTDEITLEALAAQLGELNHVGEARVVDRWTVEPCPY